MYQQRKEPENLDVGGLWQPMILTEKGERLEFRPEPPDAYVVVDEIIGDDVRLAVASWPSVDAGGRLRFDDQGSEAHDFARAALQIELDHRRSDEGQLPRPLRIGDVFLIRGLGDIGIWGRALDVTRASRQAAKRAGLRAVAQLTPEQTVAAEPLESLVEAEQPAEPRWRRRPPRSAPTDKQQPPAGPSPGSIANAAV